MRLGSAGDSGRTADWRNAKRPGYIPRRGTKRMRTLLFGLAAGVMALLVACGGGEAEAPSASSPLHLKAPTAAPAGFPVQATMRPTLALRADAAPRRMPSAGELFDWAERTYPAYFPSHRANQSLSPYVFRFYPETGNYVGLDGDTVMILGPLSGGVLLVVGRVSDFACQVVPAECNTAPVASAGAPQSVVAGASVLLDGSASFDADGDVLTFAWALTSRPVGSAATLDSPASVKPSFAADKPGTYLATLVVRDAFAGSTAVTVTITANAANAPPVANAGPNQSVLVGSMVTLDGTGSTDADGDSLGYVWTLTARPAGSSATLSGATTAKPAFAADKPGDYVASLVVSDGKAASLPSTVSVSALVENAAPTANAGSAQVYVSGGVVTLDGSASSDPDGDVLAFQWAFTAKPQGSLASLANATTAKPSFLADVPGIYVIGLIVSDGRLASQNASVSITILAPTVHLLLWGGPNLSVYLGCLTCNQFHAESVCNPFGTFGSEFGANSIWNQFGTYGSSFSTSSPWNQFSSSGPAIFDTNSAFYGYFTVNQFRSQRTTVDFARQTLHFYSATGNLPQTRAYLCGN